MRPSDEHRYPTDLAEFRITYRIPYAEDQLIIYIDATINKSFLYFKKKPRHSFPPKVGKSII